MKTSRLYFPRVQLIDREYQIPIFAPNNIAILDGETAELARVKILIILRVWMAADKITNIHNLSCVVVKVKTNTQIPSILGPNDIDLFHKP